MSDDDSYEASVPDHCDRIVWRGRYYGLPYPNHAQALEQVDALSKALTAERQRARMPEELAEQLRTFRDGDSADHYNLLRDLLAWHEQGQKA
jgi:hypothetical protein